MNTILVGILVLIPVFGMILILAMCKSAAMADREMDRSWSANYQTGQQKHDRMENNNELAEAIEDQAAASGAAASGAAVSGRTILESG